MKNVSFPSSSVPVRPAWSVTPSGKKSINSKGVPPPTLPPSISQGSNYTQNESGVLSPVLGPGGGRDLPGSPPPPHPRLLLPVSHPRQQHSDEEQLMKGNTCHSNRACPSSPPLPTCSKLRALQTEEAHFRERGGIKTREANSRRQFQSAFAVFSNRRMTRCALQASQRSRFP